MSRPRYLFDSDMVTLQEDGTIRLDPFDAFPLYVDPERDHAAWADLLPWACFELDHEGHEGAE